jgi:transposase InsO family protein
MTSNSLYSIEKLDGTNYHSWKFKVKMILIDKELWDVVNEKDAPTEGDEGFDEWSKADQKALATIALTVKDSQHVHISTSKTSAEAWKALENIHEGSGVPRRLNLRRKLFTAKLKENETMIAYISRVMTLVQQLEAMKAGPPDEDIVVILLGGLPESYENLVTSIESRAEMPSSEYVKERLIYEEKKRSEKSEANESQESGLMVKSFKNRKSWQQPKDRNRDKSFKCFHCGKAGHKSFECPKKAHEGKSKAKVASGEKFDDNFALVAALSAKDIDSGDSWCVDSGATQHLCARREWFSEYESIPPKKIYLADETAITAKGKGNIPLQFHVDGNKIKATLHNVLYVPNLDGNLLSVSQVVSRDFRVVFEGTGCKIECRNGKVIAKANRVGGLYKLAAEVITPSKEKAAIASSSSKVDLELWHRRLGHLGADGIKFLSSKGLVVGLDIASEKSLELCKGCLEGKQHREAFPSGKTKRASDFLEIVHSDVCGPMKYTSIGGSNYFLTFIDDYSRMTFVYFLKSKDEVFEKFKEFKALVENQCGKKIKCLRNDNGGEYTSHLFTKFLKDNGIRHQKTVPYTPQQNGVAERANRTIVEKARCMLYGAELHRELWAEAVSTAVYLKNISPTRALSDKTPFEAWTGTKPSIEHLKAFGCKAHAHIPSNQRSKFDSKSVELIFVGYPPDSKGYKLLNPSTKSVKIYRDVVFDERQRDTDSEVVYVESGPIKSKPGHDSSPSSPPPSSPLPPPVGEVEESIIVVETDKGISSASEEETEHDEGEKKKEESTPPESPKDTPSTSAPPSHPASSTSTEKPKRNRKPPARYADYAKKAVVGEEPTTVKEALEGPDSTEWKKAMEEEYSSIMKNKTWTLEVLPAGRKAIGSKWVFKIKYDSKGNIEKYKARLVAKGYSQMEGIDYNETFAPVAKFNSIRILISLAAKYDLELHQMDVKTAFLNGNLEEEIYMQQPEAFIEQGKENKVCRLQKSIYGLKQAGRSWYKKIDDFFLKLGFQRTHADCCVYHQEQEDIILLIAIYVDDLIILSNDLDSLNYLKAELSKKFEMKDLGEAHYILGIEVCRNRQEKSIRISQSKYIDDILRRFNMTDSLSVSTPLEIGLKLNKGMAPSSEEERKEMENIPYKSAVGSLMYAMLGTRPDICYAVGALSRFSSNPGATHWKAVKRVFKYLKGTKDFAIEYKADEDDLKGYSDADWAGDIDDRRSTTGYTFIIAAGAVTWSSKKQPTVALSTTEAEYMAITQAAKEAIWIGRLLSELGFSSEGEVISIYGDNQGSISLSKNSVYHARTKHIDIQHHFIREKTESGEIKLIHCPTNRMPADILTKALTKEKHDVFSRMLGMVGA